jgi:hypothetical protein
VGEILELKKLSLMTSASAFILGALYVFSDGASITADVVNSSGESAGFTAIIGLSMILCSIGLFIVSINSTDHRSIDLERLVRRTKDHRELNAEPLPRQKEEEYVEKR